MIVWLGFGVAVLGGLLGLPRARDFAKAIWSKSEPKAIERRMDNWKFLLVVVGVVIGMLGYKRALDAKTDLQARVIAERESRVDLQHKVEGIKDKVIPRHLEAAQRRKLVQAVNDIGGLPPFIIYGMPDNESRAYMEQIVEALAEAGCDLRGSRTLPDMQPELKGLVIGYSATRTEPPIGALRLMTVLGNVGLDAEFRRGDVPGDEYRLYVGANPVI